MSANILWGMRRGFYFACCFSMLVCVEYLVLGSAPFRHVGITFTQVIVLYFSAGLTAGGVVGVLRPFNGTLAGATIIGIIAAAIVYGAILILIAGLPNHWDGIRWFSWVVLSVLVGGYLGSDTA